MVFPPPKKTFQLDEYDPSKAYSFILIGSSRSGKSSFLREGILEKLMPQRINVLMTESMNADAYKLGIFKKDVVICPTWMPQLVLDMHKINRHCDNKYPFTVICDDLVGFRTHKVMKKMMTTMRNCNISTIVAGQTASILDNVGRSNAHFVMLGSMNSDREIENVIRAFLLSTFPTSMSMIEKIVSYKELTKDHHFIVLNNLTGDSFITKLSLKR